MADNNKPVETEKVEKREKLKEPLIKTVRMPFKRGNERFKAGDKISLDDVQEINNLTANKLI